MLKADDVFRLELPFSPLRSGETNVRALANLFLTRGIEWCISNRSDELLAAPHWWNVVEAIAANFDWAKFQRGEPVVMDGDVVRGGCRRVVALAVAFVRGAAVGLHYEGCEQEGGPNGQ